jgi:predicted hydrocarbon binding protein
MSKEELSEKVKRFILGGYELQGRIFLSVLRTLENKYGRNVRELMRDASYNNGIRLGSDMSKKIGGNGVKEFVKAWEDMWGFGGPPVEVSDRRVVYRGNSCAAYDVWKNLGLNSKEISELADLYCVNDVGFAKGFNPKLELKHTKRLAKGDPCCEWVIEYKE